jgi:16S rRNA U516 pseudouridylate synthase RsuA-like enzyme
MSINGVASEHRQCNNKSRTHSHMAGYAPGHDTPQREVERLNFNVSPTVAQEVRAMAGEMNISMTQLFRYAFGILKIATLEAKKNRKLVIADEEGRPVREIVLPG